MSSSEYPDCQPHLLNCHVIHLALVESYRRLEGMRGVSLMLICVTILFLFKERVEERSHPPRTRVSR